MDMIPPLYVYIDTETDTLHTCINVRILPNNIHTYRDGADSDFRLPKARVFARINEVAHHRDLAATAERVA
jgi:hypothetical protein